MSGVQSVQRAFLILQALAARAASLTEISHRVGLPKSTVSRLLRTLEDAEAVTRDPDSGTYRIGPAVGQMAGAGGHGADLLARVRPQLTWLTQEAGEDAGFSVPDGYRVHYVAQADSDNPVQVRDWTGELIPMHCVPSGVVILAHWPEEAVERFLARPLEAFTGRTLVEPGALRERLVEVRSRGYAWGMEEFVEGINSVACPLLDSRGRPLGALHVHGPAYRFPDGRGDEVVAHLRAAVDRVGRQPA